MKGLFWRIFVLSWVAMAVVGVGFSLLVAASYPTARMERRVQRVIASFGLQGEEVLRMRARAGDAAAVKLLREIAADLEDDLWLFEGDAVHLATLEDPADWPADVQRL